MSCRVCDVAVYRLCYHSFAFSFFGLLLYGGSFLTLSFFILLNIVMSWYGLVLVSTSSWGSCFVRKDHRIKPERYDDYVQLV